MPKQSFEEALAVSPGEEAGGLQLEDGARIAVIGGGPAGSFFTYFAQTMAARIGLELDIHIYEPRNFTVPGPIGCNMCGGIISESLVQNLAAEGINLPPTVVQRGIDSYILHTDVGRVRIETPLREKRIGAVHRGAGPRGLKEAKWDSFDGFLQATALRESARIISARVDEINWQDGKLEVKARGAEPEIYDLLVVATGINSSAHKLFKELGLAYQPPQSTKTFIREYYLGADTIEAELGTSMHVFLLNLPRLEFAAVIPKGDYATVCLLGEDIDAELIQSFLTSPEVKQCMPPGWDPDKASCQCSPRINIHGAAEPFADRLVFIGDCGVTRLYKDGIGAAYRTAKAAATTAVFQGISAEDFRRGYLPACKKIEFDNTIGKAVFAVTRQIQKRQFARRAVVQMTAKEQRREGQRRRMSMVLWDMFTGSAPYRDIFLRTLHPGFWARFVVNMVAAVWPAASPEPSDRGREELGLGPGD